jgi:hypothetical protein
MYFEYSRTLLRSFRKTVQVKPGHFTVNGIAMAPDPFLRPQKIKMARIKGRLRQTTAKYFFPSKKTYNHTD